MEQLGDDEPRAGGRRGRHHLAPLPVHLEGRANDDPIVLQILQEHAALGLARGHDDVVAERPPVERVFSARGDRAERLHERGVLERLPDAPLGGYEASRTAELGRWQNAFGEAVFQRVRRESQVAAIYLAHMALGRLSVPPSVAMPILQEAAPSAFAGERGTVLEMARYVSMPAESFVPALCHHLVEIVGHGDASQLAAALAPLVTSVEEDMTVAATFAKDATGI